MVCHPGVGPHEPPALDPGVQHRLVQGFLRPAAVCPDLVITDLGVATGGPDVGDIQPGQFGLEARNRGPELDADD